MTGAGAPQTGCSASARTNASPRYSWLIVPNHTALDHPWVSAHPEFYVEGSEEDLTRSPQNYSRVETDHGPRILAHGRDPNFPGWMDTLQLNYSNPVLQTAQLAEVVSIAE